MSKTSSDFIRTVHIPGSSSLELRDWPPEELVQIRLIFKKLTALRVENPDDAEDLVQETFLTMTEKFPAIQLRKGLLIWGMGILRKKVGNYYRRGQRTTGLKRLDQSLRVTRLLQSQPSVESSLHHAELQNLVAGILQSFRPRDRLVMDLVLAGLSTNEIVDLLHPERYQNTVNRIHRARKRLLRELARYGYGILQCRTGNRGRKPAGSSK